MTPIYAKPKSAIVKQLAMKLGVPVVDLPVNKLTKAADLIGIPTKKRNTPVTNIKKIPFTPTKHDPRYRDNKATTAQLGIFPNGMLLELAQALGLVMNKAGVVRPTHLAIREGYMAYARSADGKSNKMFYTNKGIRYIKEYQHHIPK